MERTAHEFGKLLGSVKLRGGRATRMIGGLFVFMGAMMALVGLINRPADNWPVALGGVLGGALFFLFFQRLGRRYLTRLDVHEQGIVVNRPGWSGAYPWRDVGPIADASQAGDAGSLSVTLPDKQGFILLAATEGADALRTVAELLRTSRPGGLA